MSNDIKLARLENYIEAKREGLHKIIDGTFDGLRAKLLEEFGPRVGYGPSNCLGAGMKIEVRIITDNDQR